MKKTLLLILLASMSFSCVLANYLYRVPKRQYCDFRVYYKAGQDVLRGKNIYVRETEDVTPFKYSPFFAFVFASLSLLPIKLAACVFLLINFIAAILLFRLSFFLGRDFGLWGSFPEKTCYWIYLLVFMCASRCIFLVWESGQVNIIMTVLVLASWHCLAKDRSAGAGAFLASAILIKYTPVLFLPYFLLIRKPKVVLWTAVFAAGFLMLPALLVGFDKNMTYLVSWLPSIVKTSINNGSYVDLKNQSIFSMMLRFFASTMYTTRIIFSIPLTMHLAYCLAGVFYLTAIAPSSKGSSYRHSRESGNPDLRIVDLLMILICTIIFNPNCWMINFVALTPVFMFLVQYMFNKGKDWGIAAALILAYALVNLMVRGLVGAKLEECGYVYSFAAIGTIILFLALVRIKLCAPLKSL
jgi:hypothetical protein